MCVGASSTVCSYTAGVVYTALVITTSQTGDTYDIVRRDVSQTANCSTPASTTVGGASSGLALTSDLYAACYRVTGATTDKWWFDARAQAPGTAGALLEVTNPTGAIICRQWGRSCNVSGSASYQAIVIASGYAGFSIATHLDAWKVGSASGWASQCTAHQLSPNGWATLNGTLTETSTAYCAVLTPVANREFAVFGGYPAGGSAELPYVTMSSSSNWAADPYCSGYNGFSYCQPSSLGWDRRSSWWFRGIPADRDPRLLQPPGRLPTAVRHPAARPADDFDLSVDGSARHRPDRGQRIRSEPGHPIRAHQ